MIYNNPKQREQIIDLSVIEVSRTKNPKASWKQNQESVAPIQSWYSHYINGGYVGVVTGKVSKNFETIDIDSKNDPNSNIIDQYRALIPEELYKKLLVVETPSGGLHFRYRCSVIEPNQVLARHSDKATLIETRGEGGYVCHHISDYKVIQGEFDLIRMEYSLPVITSDEREFLFVAARSLDRLIPDTKSTYQYKEAAINKFNAEFNGVDLFQGQSWSVVDESLDKVYLLRQGSNAHHSGVYFKATNVFFCFSTSTVFKPGQPYNNYQILQALENLNDFRSLLKRLAELGYPSDNGQYHKEKVSDQQIAEYLNNLGLRYNTFIQEITINGKVIEEMDNNTLYIQIKEHFNKDIARSTFENVIKSHLILKEDPIQEFIEKYKHRNPTNAIEQWVNCLKLKNENLPADVVTYFVKKWYVGLIAQCLDGEYPNEFFLAILSTKQGVGKTTLLRKYTIPEELQAYRKEVSISDDEDFKLIMSQALLIIDDEMDGRTLNEDKTFKAILSRKELPLRRKYDRRISNLNRRCSFAGCGNQVNIVRERQNRRIIPIEIVSIDYNNIKKVDQIDMFMEAYHLFKSGFRYSYDGSDSEKINQLASDYFLKTDLDEIIDDCIINPTDGNDTHQMSAIQMVDALTYKYPTCSRKVNVVSIGKILADRGIESKRVGANKRTVYLISKKSHIINIAQDLSNTESSPIINLSRTEP